MLILACTAVVKGLKVLIIKGFRHNSRCLATTNQRAKVPEQYNVCKGFNFRWLSTSTGSVTTYQSIVTK